MGSEMCIRDSFRPDESLEQSVREKVAQAQSELKHSESLYLKAEEMLLEGLGWDKLDLSQPRWWAVSLSRAREVHRIDAEHFQPKYDKLISYLKGTGKTRQMIDVLAEPIRKGVTPVYDPEGTVSVVNSQHLGRQHLNVEATDRTTGSFWEANKRARIRQYDVMMYATGAPYVGRSNIFLEEMRALAGVDLMLLRPKPEICDPSYLAVFCNSPLGMLQAEMYQTGSNQQHLYPSGVSQFWVYIPSPEFQRRIAELVYKAWEARRKAKSLLEDAVLKVETLIESETK